MIINTTFGQNLKKLRENQNLTQIEVANALGISRQSISKWERDIGLPLVTYIIPLSKIYCCSVKDFFTVYERDEVNYEEI